MSRNKRRFTSLSLSLSLALTHSFSHQVRRRHSLTRHAFQVSLPARPKPRMGGARRARKTDRPDGNGSRPRTLHPEKKSNRAVFPLPAFKLYSRAPSPLRSVVYIRIFISLCIKCVSFARRYRYIRLSNSCPSCDPFAVSIILTIEIY